MQCLGCNGAVDETLWGPWCDPCGGVVVGGGHGLIFRHVATVQGEGGTFPIVYDKSSSAYAHMLKEPNPNAHLNGGDDGFHRPPVQVVHGTLDAVLAIAYPDARGDGPGASLAPAPSATVEETARLRIEF